MTGQDLRRPVDHFLGNGGAIVQARRRYCYRLRPESKEMVHRFIGVGESVAGLERGNDLEYFDNDSADALRNLVGQIVGATVVVFDHLRQLAGEAIGRAQQEAIVTHQRAIQPFGIIGLRAADLEDAAQILPRERHAVAAAAVLEQNEIMKLIGEVLDGVGAQLIFGDLRQLIKSGRRVEFENRGETKLHVILRNIFAGGRTDGEAADTRIFHRVQRVGFLAARGDELQDFLDRAQHRLDVRFQNADEQRKSELRSLVEGDLKDAFGFSWAQFPAIAGGSRNQEALNIVGKMAQVSNHARFRNLPF